MVVYRGSNYEGPSSKSRPLDREGDTLFVLDASSSDSSAERNVDGATSTLEKSELAVSYPNHSKTLTEEEAEFNNLLDSLGPRFHEWWATGILLVDADLLPQNVPGYKTRFRFAPTGMQSLLTNGEMTNLRKFSRSLPCHFAIGRNRNNQGLAAAILKLWEKSLVTKITLKWGIQNTNKLMAEELKDVESRNIRSSEDHRQFDHVSNFPQSEDEAISMESDDDYDSDEDSELSSFDIDDDPLCKNG